MRFLKIRLNEESPLEIGDKILEIAVRTGVAAGKITRTVGEIGVITKGIFRATGGTEVTTEEISKATGDSDEIIKGISEPIAKFKGITNDIIPHD